VIGAQQGAGLSVQLRQLQDFIRSVRVRSSDDKKFWFIKLVDKKRGQLKMDTARDAMGRVLTDLCCGQAVARPNVPDDELEDAKSSGV
jgi:hypothetical protein